MSGLKGTDIPEIFTKSDEEMKRLLVIRLQTLLMHLQGLGAQMLVGNVNVLLDSLIRVNTENTFITVYQNELILRHLDRISKILSEQKLK